MVLSLIRRLQGRSSDAVRVCLEVRPDGLAWAQSPGLAGQQCGFAECSPAKRAATLNALVTERGWHGADATLVLPMEQYQIFQLEHPEGVDDNELADALKWKLKDFLDFSPADAVSDVFPFPEDASRGRGALVNVVAARKPLVTELVTLVNEASLVLIRIDVAELALRNLASRLDSSGRGAALVHLRDSYGQMVICKGPVLYLSRRLDVSAGDLRDASQQENAVQSLALEMQRSLDYYESQMGQVPPRVVHLVARDALLPLSSMLGSYVAAQIDSVDWPSLGLDKALDSRCLAAWSAGLMAAGGAGR